MSTTTVTNKFIDIKQVIRSKNPKLLTLLPRFVIRYIRKILHEDDVNDFIKRHGHKTGFDFVTAIIEEFKVNVVAKGQENIPATGGCIFAANHPLGGLDGMALFKAIEPVRTDVKFIVNDILLQLKQMSSLLTGVNKHGKITAQTLENIDAIYSSGIGVLVYPAGLVSRKQNGIVKDLEWKKSFITRARKNNLPIIPVHIGGANTPFFYNLALFRKRLGIKANIEMFYLVNEMYKQKNKTITIIFGKPLSPQTFDKRANDNEWAERVKEHVYALSTGDKSKMIE